MAELISLFVFFYCANLTSLLLLSGDIHQNPGPHQIKNKIGRVAYANVRGLYRNLNDLIVLSSNFDIILCSETLVSNFRNINELLLPNFNKPFLIKRDSRPRARGMALYIRSGFNAQHITKFACTCHEVQLVKIPSRFNNFYIVSIYRNPDLGSELYDCLLLLMASIQSSDKKASFIFIGDFNAHHQDWLKSISPTNRNGLAALDFANLSGCDQLIDGPTHISGNCLDLLLTDVPGVIKSYILSPVGTSDHCAIACNVKLQINVPDITFSRKVYIKSHINWDNVRLDFMNIKWSEIFHSRCPVSSLNTCLTNIISRRVPSKIIRTRMKDKAWFNDDCRRAFNDKQSAYKLWKRNPTQICWNNYLYSRAEAQRIYSVAETDYNNHLRDVLSGATHPHKWWTALKSSLFGTESTMPPLCSSDGSVIFDPVLKANLLSDVFVGKQSSTELNLPATCFPEPLLKTIAFKSSELKDYLLELDAFGGTDPDGFFPLFFKKIGDILAPKLAVVFRQLLRSGSFPLCWRKSNVTPIPKTGIASSNPNEYRPISITPILSKLFERLLARRLSTHLESHGYIPSSQFGFRKGLGTCDALLTLTYEIQLSLDRGQESRGVFLDFSSAFDLVNHQGLLYKLKLCKIGGNLLNIFNQFLFDRTQRVQIDGCFSDSVHTVSGVPQGSVLGPLFFIIFTSDLGLHLENSIVSYADNTTLFAPIPSPSMRTDVAASLNRDLNKIYLWCNTWGMRLNANKTHSMIFSRSRTSNPPHPSLLINDIPISNVNGIKALGVVLDSKLTFEKHIRSLSASVCQKSGLLRKCFKRYSSDSIVLHSFYSFILPYFEYCAPVWMSAAESHLRLLNKALNSIRFLLPNLSIDLHHRRLIGALSMFFKIYNNQQHPLNPKLPSLYVPLRQTRRTVALNSCALVPMNCSTNQFCRCFVPFIIEVWNSLPDFIVHSNSVNKFKYAANKYLS